MSKFLVLEAARNEIGYEEKPNNNNKFAKVAGHANYQPWCATFIRACFILGNEDKAIPDSAYCPHIEAWAKVHNVIVPCDEAQKGDIALFDFTRSGKSEHIGIITHDFNPLKPTILRTIEGNTGAVSQDNGEGVAKKVRQISLIRYVFRPKWSKENEHETPNRSRVGKFPRGVANQ